MNFRLAVSLVSASPVVAFVVPNSGNHYGKKNPMPTIQVVASPETETSPITPTNNNRPIYDPLGLYPESSLEKQQGMIRPLEPTLEVNQLVADPMGLYPKDSPEYIKSLEQEQNGIAALTSKRPIYDPLGLYPESSIERQDGMIELMEPEIQVNKQVNDPMGLYPKDSMEYEEAMTLEKENLVNINRDLYDPLGLYQESSVERQQGKIQVLEPIQIQSIKPVLDPMNLYTRVQKDNDEVDKNVVMSQALPFLPKPAVLVEEEGLAGNFGFDPLGFAKSKDDLVWQRQAELKHSRIAMLAAVGWPLSELWDKQIASILHMKPLLVDGDRIPSLLNGGLAHVNLFYWMGIVAVAGLFETLEMMKQNNNDIFDPMGLFPKDDVEGQKRFELSEIKHGRIAMIAITVFALVEAWTKTAIVDATPFFFHGPF